MVPRSPLPPADDLGAVVTDVADRHWGQSLVRAPTAKDAAGPGGSNGGSAPPPPPGAVLGTDRPTSALAGTFQAAPRLAPMPPAAGRPPMAAVEAALPPVLVEPAIASDTAAPPAALLPWPAAMPAVAFPVAPAELGADQSLARLARGVQDCARALASLADRLDGLELRLGDRADAPVARPVPPEPTRGRTGSPEHEALDVRVRALEGMAGDRLQALDQRLRRLETLPLAVGRLQQDTALLANLARTRVPDEGGRREPDLAPVYQELDSVAEVVSSHAAAATQSLERVRTLERAVLEMRRHLERNLAEHTRTATSEQIAARGRVDSLEARLAAAESSMLRG